MQTFKIQKCRVRIKRLQFNTNKAKVSNDNATSSTHESSGAAKNSTPTNEVKRAGNLRANSLSTKAKLNAKNMNENNNKCVEIINNESYSSNRNVNSCSSEEQLTHDTVNLQPNSKALLTPHRSAVRLKRIDRNATRKQQEHNHSKQASFEDSQRIANEITIENSMTSDNIVAASQKSNSAVNECLDLLDFEKLISLKGRRNCNNLSLTKRRLHKDSSSSKQAKITQSAINGDKAAKIKCTTELNKRAVDSSTASEKSQTTTNLAKDNAAIERLLLCSDEELELVLNENTKDKQKPAKAAENVKHKFFHKKRDQLNVASSSNKIAAEARKAAAMPKTTQLNGKRITDAVSTVNIYEYLSQSQTSDSDATRDPTADIVQKMIQTGKVRVATRLKGKGKPVIKRLKPNKAQKNKVKVNRRNLMLLNAKEAEQLPIKMANMPQRAKKTQKMVHFADSNDDDDGHYEDAFNDTEIILDDGPSTSAAAMAALKQRENQDKSMNGTFSDLARTVLLQQTSLNEQQNGKKKQYAQSEVLNAVRKFVSTPINRKTAPAHNANLSPIVGATFAQKPASPWRVNEETHLPNVFYFGVNSSNLPSFSSDYITCSPRKQKKSSSRICDVGTAQECETENEIAESSINALATEPPEVLATELSEVVAAQTDTSASLNDSNAENMPPAAVASLAEQNTDANANIFNLHQTPNPRRVLTYRSPLKAINILEVITLPNVNELIQKEAAEKATKEAPAPQDAEQNILKEFEQNENLQNFSQLTNEATLADEHDDADNDNENVDNKQLQEQTNLFGFEEFMGSDEMTADFNQTVNKTHENVTPQHDLSRRLKKLKKWRPKKHELPVKIQDQKPISAVFNEQPKQRRIKDMLCSTMIRDMPSSGLKATKNDLPAAEAETSDASTHLFMDESPTGKFDETKVHRTYARAPKRRRKCHHNFFMVLSDDSEEEHQDDEAEHSSEAKGQKNKPKKKRQKRENNSKNKEDLDSFVQDFNEMCKEVDDFELLVE